VWAGEILGEGESKSLRCPTTQPSGKSILSTVAGH